MSKYGSMIKHFGTTASKKNQRRRAKSEKSARSAVLLASLMSFLVRTAIRSTLLEGVFLPFVRSK